MSDADSPQYLFPLLTDASQLKREAVKRRNPQDVKSVYEGEVPYALAAGWEVDRALTKKTRLKRPKAIDERLENKFWMLLYKLGYQELNQGRFFKILIERKGAESLTKQIDVFAKDDETVVVAECKANQKLAKRGLQKDIEEFANLKGPIARAIERHYGREFKPKIIWMFVTENIIWSRQDYERAAGERIRVVRERELRYYVQIAEHLGAAARYQFLAEFLKDQEIPGLKGRTVPAIRGKLGGRRFYCFVTRPRDLLKISFVNHRSLNDPDGAPTYQRLVSKSRMRDIGKFIAKGGFFPTNILINFTRAVRFDQSTRDEDADISFGILYLPDKYRSAWIIDGQHRLYGFSKIDDKFLDTNIIVVAFEKMDKSEEAQLFVTINHEQRSVPKHLLDDLEGELKWGSSVPSERIGAIASRLINLLNTDAGFPFYGRVPQQGIASNSKACLTIPALKDGLRRSGLLGRVVMDRSHYELGPLCGKDDKETLERARCALTSYFEQIRDANLSQWESGRAGILCTNTAVQAYIQLLASLIRYWEVDAASDPREMDAEELIAELEEYLQPVLDVLAQKSDDELKSLFTVPFGSGGPPEYYFRLCNIVKSRYADFKPEGMEEWIASRSEANVAAADRQVKDICTETQRHVFEVLKLRFGEGYWQKGVVDKKMKADAYAKSLDEEERGLPLETYLDFIDLKKIIENKQNWPDFRDVFDIPEVGEKGRAKNLKWMDRINELRRISAHPTRDRGYKVEDFEYIEYIHRTLLGRLEGWRWKPADSLEDDDAE